MEDVLAAEEACKYLKMSKVTLYSLIEREVKTSSIQPSPIV